MPLLVDNDTGFCLLDRSQIEMTGQDRAQLLHGLCTNDIKRLKPGQGCETFLTNVQGKVIGFVNVYCGHHSLILDSTAGEAPAIIKALDRYVIREKVQFADRSQDWRIVMVTGARAEQMLTEILGQLPPAEYLGHVALQWQRVNVSLRRTRYVSPVSYEFSAPVDASRALGEKLESAGIRGWTDEQIETLRIESGTPLYGKDITADNLPQEVDRNALAISFTKGCYLGQETVARIDALGHVNRVLRGIRFESEQQVAAGVELVSDSKVVARITSVCRSERIHAPLALAYVRRGQEKPGTRLATQLGSVEVIKLPLE